MIVFSVLIEIGCPLIYWGRISAKEGRDYRRMFAALGLLSLFYFVLGMFYGAHFGVISWQKAESEAITSLITIPLMALAGYYLFTTIVLPHLVTPRKPGRDC